MSGSNALAAAKRRRVDSLSKPATPVARPNASQQRPKATTSASLPSGARISPQQAQAQTQAQARAANTVVQRNQPPPPPQNPRSQPFPQPTPSASPFQMSTISEDNDASQNIFVIPTPPEGVKINPLQLLSVHHAYINKMANHIPPALETLGENFNMMSANCDNLNDRLEVLEKNGGSGGASAASNPETIRKVELLSDTIAALSRTVEELKTNLSKLYTISSTKDVENTKFRQDILTKQAKLSSDLDELRSPISDLQLAVSELRNPVQEEDGQYEDDAQENVEEEVPETNDDAEVEPDADAEAEEDNA